MSTTLADIAYEEHFVKQHDEYVKSLEKVASSKSLKELKNNLQQIEDHFDQIDRDGLDGLVEDVKSLKDLTSILEADKKRATVLAVLGLVLSVVFGVIAM